MSSDSNAVLTPFHMNRGPIVIELGRRKFSDQPLKQGLPDHLRLLIDDMDRLSDAELDARADIVLTRFIGFRLMALLILGVVYKKRGNAVMLDKVQDALTSDTRRMKLPMLGAKPSHGGIKV